MQRYFIEQNLIHDSEIIIQGNDHHHMKRVMRFNVGDQVIVHTYQGDAYLCDIVAFNKSDVRLSIVESLPVKPARYHLDLGLVLTKKDAFELALKKATELGVTGFLPLLSERSIIKIDDFNKKKARYQSICKESAEQSERHQLPNIYDLSSLDEIDASDYDHLFFAYAREEDQSVLDQIKAIKPDETSLVLIGPEGGFSKKEYDLLVHKGFQSMSLGETILRAETAAIFVVSSFRLLVGGQS